MMATLQLLLLLAAGASRGQEPPPRCPDRYTVCNALLHAEKPVDLGLYCHSSCSLCSSGTLALAPSTSVAPAAPDATPTADGLLLDDSDSVVKVPVAPECSVCLFLPVYSSSTRVAPASRF